jgi:phosphate transport system permease protein
VSDVLVRPAPPPSVGIEPPRHTTLPERNPAAPPVQPRRLRSAVQGSFDVVGALITALCISTLLFGRLAALSGPIGFVIVNYVIFIATFALLVSLHEDRQAVIDRLATVMLWSAAIVMAGALVFILFYTFFRGRQALAHSNFYTQDLARAGSLSPLKVGGIKHAIVGTLWMISIAMVLTVPLGLMTAVYLSEVGGRLARVVRTIVEAMTALPSIVAGLFIFAAFVLVFHQQTAFAASLALAVDMLPIIIRAADVVLRLVPGTLREASAAVGSSRWRTTWHVVLPTARSGLATAVILGMARGLGETAPVLLTAGYTTILNTDPFKGPMVSLPLVAFTLVKSGIPTMQARGFAAASVLLVLVVALFALARFIGGRGPGNLSPRQRRRAARASTRDANRIIRRHDRRAQAAAAGAAP